MDRKEFWKQVKEYESKGLRRGQAMCTVAYELDSVLCHEAKERIGDPFYLDECATLFYVEFVALMGHKEAMFTMLDEPIANFKKGIVSDPIDLEEK